MTKKEFFKIVEIIKKEEKSFYFKNQEDLSTTVNVIKFLFNSLKLYLTDFETVEFLPYFTVKNIDTIALYFAYKKEKIKKIAEEYDQWKKRKL